MVNEQGHEGRVQEGEEFPAIAETVRRLAGGEETSPQEQNAALDWFLTDEAEDLTHTFEINVGTPDTPQWIPWTIRTVDQDTLRRIRRLAEVGGRTQRRRQQQATGSAEIDSQQANLRIVVEGTVAPDLAEIAQRKGIPEAPDPALAAMMVVKHRFRHKPGLIDQIAGEVMTLSGYDDEDVREPLAGKLSPSA